MSLPKSQRKNWDKQSRHQTSGPERKRAKEKGHRVLLRKYKEELVQVREVYRGNE